MELPSIGQDTRLVPPPDVYHFGSFELDAATGELRKHGLRVKLQDQPSKILVLLIQHAGEVVTREDIQRELWPADVHVDFENAINSAVRKLRDCLGDSADSPRFIETLSRRGYRFTAPLSAKVFTPPAPVTIPVPDKVEPRRLIIPMRIVWAWVALVGVGIGIAYLWLMRPATRQQAAQLSPVPFTTYPGVECCPSFSPDGSRIAFSWNGPDQNNFDIYVKQVGPGEPVRMTKDLSKETFPAWSPDGNSIAFLRQVDDLHAAIVLMPSLGPGNQREAARTNIDWATVDRGILPGPLLAWSPDNKYLFTTDVVDEKASFRIVRVSVDTGEKQEVVVRPPDPPGAPGDGSITVSPDGRTMAFVRVAAVRTSSDIYTVPLSKDALPEGKPERLTSDSKFISGLAWADGGRELVFSSDRSGRWELWRIALSGSKQPERVVVLGNVDAARAPMEIYLAISPPTGKLAYAQPSVQEGIWRVPVPAGKGTKPERLISSTRSDRNAQYSPDGARIAFASDRSGRAEIFVCNADGSSPMQLTSFDNGFAGSPRWSPDGTKIAFDSTNTGNWGVYTVSAQGGKALALTHDHAAIPSWSRDGKWIYFAALRTGRNEIWKARASGGGEVQVTRNGGFVAFESMDGRHLYYTKTATGSALWEMETGGTGERKVLELVVGRNLAVSRGGIYFVSDANSGRAIQFLDFGSRGITTIAPVDQFFNNGLAVSPDARSIMHNKVVATGSELMLVENFR